MRLNLALVDGASGAQCWADIFVAERQGLPLALGEFAVQVERALQGELYRAAVRRPGPALQPPSDAEGLAMRAYALWYRGCRREHVLEALPLLQQAVARDADCARAWAGLAFMRGVAWAQGWAGVLPQVLAQVDEAVAQLDRLDRDGHYTDQSKFLALFLRGQEQAMRVQAEAWCERHARPTAFGSLGAVQLMQGEFDAAVASLQRALRLSPRDPIRADWQHRLAMAHLAAGRLQRVAVVGPNADDDLEQLGDWSLGAGQGQGTMQKHARASTSTVLDGLRAALPSAQVTHARGCNADCKDPGADRIPAAVRAAEGADVCVLVLGDAIAYVGEGKSTATLDLPGAQRQLFDAIAATGVPIVVVLLCSKPLAIPYIERRADAILLAHNPGMAGGTAIAEALLGAFNPSGRLTISWPHHVGQQPVRYDQFAGAHFWGYPDLPGVEGATPVFCFGEGLSYTTFRYEALRLQARTLATGEALRFALRVSNTGERADIETVQVYVRDIHTSVSWPAKRLKAWKRVELASGAATEVAFELPYQDLALCDAEGNWVVEPGEFELIVACSSHEPRWGGNCLKAKFSVA
ncbi:MAG: glycoside hydrolase family 3 C-terminal domain-containing protein [Planctomycetes bacterium]|nr:glycoside hydrolase family 3 C-terminal domain-containing protein [Planctomycetota bacterium]